MVGSIGYIVFLVFPKASTIQCQTSGISSTDNLSWCHLQLQSKAPCPIAMQPYCSWFQKPHWRFPLKGFWCLWSVEPIGILAREMGCCWRRSLDSGQEPANKECAEGCVTFLFGKLFSLDLILEHLGAMDSSSHLALVVCTAACSAWYIAMPSQWLFTISTTGLFWGGGVLWLKDTSLKYIINNYWLVFSYRATGKK